MILRKIASNGPSLLVFTPDTTRKVSHFLNSEVKHFCRKRLEIGKSGEVDSNKSEIRSRRIAHHCRSVYNEILRPARNWSIIHGRIWRDAGSSANMRPNLRSHSKTPRCSGYEIGTFSYNLVSGLHLTFFLHIPVPISYPDTVAKFLQELKDAQIPYMGIGKLYWPKQN